MDQTAFTAGVRPGGLTSRYEVNILICYVMEQMGQPLGFSLLSEAIQKHQLANYFEFADAMARLERDGHISSQPDEGERLYTLTPMGREAAQVFYKNLPRAVRERAVDAARKALLRQRREKEIVTEIEKTQDGYRLTIRMTDIGSDLLSVSLFLPTQEACDQVQKRFRNDPMFIYQSILSLMTGTNSAGEPTPSGLNLYD